MRKFTSGYLTTWYRLLPSPASVQLCVLMVLAAVEGTMASYKLPAFIEMDSNVTATQGSRVELRCGARHLGTKRIIWKKVDTKEHKILTVGKMVFTDDTAINVLHKENSHNWNLVIKPVRYEHSGLYECQISTQEDLKAYIMLNVIDKGIVLEGSSYVEKGEPIVLTCNITGDGFLSSDVDWFKNGLVIHSDVYKGIHIDTHHVYETRILHSVLTIERSKMDDRGIYVCRSNAGSEVKITSKTIMVLNGNSSPKIPRSKIGDKYVDSGDSGLDFPTPTPKTTPKPETEQGGPQKVPRDTQAETNPGKRDKQHPSSVASGISKPHTSSGVSIIVCLICLLTLLVSS